MKSLRLWIGLLALLSFAAGGAAGALAAVKMFRPAPEAGPFTEYERELAHTFQLSPERTALLHVLIAGYERDIERVKSSHMAHTLSAMEPELADLGRWYGEQIRDKVLPPARRAEFDSPSFVSTWTPPR
ncbi:MAG TPA: hypothetical protein VGR31_04385 [Planctomycetota bacterium]|jgi:hypothetical protein|nr:hypothetical protein [Planctomycetota bacterium]